MLHQLRSIVESIDITIHTPPNESLPASLESESRFSQVLQAIHTAQATQAIEIAKNAQKQVDNIEKKVEPVADRITEGVIEFRARTVMAQSMLKAFFLPGMVKQQPPGPLLLPEAIDSGKSIPAEVTAEGSSLHDGSSNVVVTQVDPSDGNVQITTIRESKRSENEGTE